ncbi:O-antigen translocase [Hydrogenivirga sp. 128-5-R1-1]|uniref:O-antigen translocase n=1 Tax=Hydrogenivirga sp. 128-5-R1-1 TaxID=392423 RepID=UPI00015EF896|nr:O-antigen translocase [Hydrogenivirga sp. 128-5-R1-1]EDP75580.1 lipopolysaccharide biosynthesis protein [Hydrogenivirga sp. 128-5-R1-1]
MNLIKTSILSAISTIIRILAGFIINKMIAVYIGPSGVALFGQFRNFMSMVITFSNGAINQGIVKYTAEYKDIESKQKLFSTSLVIGFISSIVLGILIIIFRNELSKLILHTTEFSDVFIILGIFTVLFSLNNIFLSILNGEKEIKKYISVNIASSIFVLILTILLVIKFKLKGAFLSLILGQSLIIVFTLFLVIKSRWFKVEYFLQGIDKESLRRLLKFSSMTITAATMVPLSQIAIRNYIGIKLGWDSAGYWQGVFFISEVYLMVITTSLSVYYLPRLSEIQDKKELKKEILNGYRIIMPIVIFLAFLIFIFKKFIVVTLFSEKFLPMLELFKWQLIGDVIKIASWLLGYIMVAKALTKLFVLSEILFTISWVVFTIVFVYIFGLIGSVYAFTFNYILYLLFLGFYFRRIIL